jgi:Domain of unknown function (DUF4388)
VLQGTFDTLALQELLGLLAHSRKTGALGLDAGPASAVVYVTEGRCCAALSNESGEPVSDAPSLVVRLVDLCFAVARTDDGSFRFGSEEPPWVCADTIDLDVANDELSRLLEEWREIQAVIPSLECRIKLSEDLGIDELVVDRERWRLLTAIDGRRSVRDLVRKTNRPVLDVCHALLALVDAGACSVVQAPTPAATTARSTGGKASRPVVDPETPYGPGVETPHIGPGPAGHEEENGEVPEGAGKGQYLRVFSALHNS